MAMSDQATYDPSLGLVRLSRRHLSRLTDLMEPEAQTDSSSDRQLTDIGALRSGRPHPALVPVISVIARTSSRFWLRRWEDERLTVIEGMIGPGGIVILPNGTDPDELQDLRHHVRPGCLARVLATLLALDPTHDDTSTLGNGLPKHPLTWPEIRAAAGPNPPGWIGTEQPDDRGPVRLHDLIWQPPIPGQTHGRNESGARGSVAVLIDLGGPRIAEVRPTSEPEPTYRLVPRRAEEVWFGLCRIAAEAQTRTCRT